jgi:transcriptional regulator with XRE-family HTH domain
VTMQPTQDDPIGLRIKRFRSERGMSATELANAAGVSKSYLSALEKGGETQRRPSAKTLYSLASAMGVAMSDLLGRPIITQPPAERPESLMQFARDRDLPEADIDMLAGIRFRGEQPRTPERWAFIYDSIRNSAGMDNSEP